MPESVMPLIAVGVVAVLFILLVSLLSNNDSLNGIKSKTVGDGQHGTARWATLKEVQKAYTAVRCSKLARGKESARGAGTHSRQRAARQAAGSACGQRRCALPHDRRVGRW